MDEPSQAVFLSYASQDAEAARRICEALRAAGVEVWFDQSELRGGDAWDQKIRRQIKECALFVPIISANTNSRPEGYFRLEWKLAVDRSHLLADDHPFLFPIVIGEVSDAAARVPDKFRDVQWTRLRLDETPSELAARVARLLRGEQEAGSRAQRREASGGRTERHARPAWLRYAWVAVGLTLALFYGLRPLWHTPRTKDTRLPAEAAGPSAGFLEAQKLERQARALIDDDPLVVRENFKTAVELCERAVALAPDFGDGWATLARANFELYSNYNERSDRSLAALRTQVERAIRLAPHSLEAELAQANFELMNEPGSRESGVAGYRQKLLKLHEQAPDDRRILGLLINLQEDSKMGTEPTDAVRWAELANARPGGDADALVRLAWVYWSLNRFRELSDALERSLAIQPTSSGYHLKLMLLLASGDLAGAQAWLKQIPPSILQEDRVAAIACQVYFALHQPEKVLEVLARNPRDFLEEGRYFTARGYLTGDALRMLGKPRAAEVDFRGALRAVEERIALTPRDSRLTYWKALLLVKLGNREEAIRQLETAREMGRYSMLDADVSAALGRNDDVIAGMDKHITPAQSRWPSALSNLKYGQVFEALRGDPRMQAIIARGDRMLAELLGKPAAAATAPAAAPTPADSPPADAKSVAVLAFTNLSDDKANEYFSDGITEELLNVLAKVPQLKVTARTSSFHFKGKDTPIPEIARQLGVAYVVEGSVRKAGGKVRITAQLIKAADGFHVWSDTFTRELKDVFAIQDEIAGLIAKNLQLELGASPAAPAASVNPQAYELYVQARQAWSLRSAEGFAEAEQLLNRALELEPGFVRAEAALADVALMRGQSTGSIGAYRQRNNPEINRVIALIRRVLEVDSSLAEAHASLGMALMANWQNTEAEAELRRATQLNPNYATGHQWLGILLFQVGRPDEGLAEMKLAAALDPLSPIILDNCGYMLTSAGRYHEALTYHDRAYALNPNWSQIRANRARTLAALGRTTEAADLARPLPADRTDDKILILGRAGFTSEAAALLAGLDQSYGHRALLLLAAGQREAALASLADRSATVPVDGVKVSFDPSVDAIRDEPRFKEFLAAVGWTEAHARAQAWRAAHPPEEVGLK